MGADQRAALEQLRRAIRGAAPDAVECISYGVLAFRRNGKFLVGMGAGKAHCSFYPGAALQAFKDEFAGFETRTGTIRFQPKKPIPAALVRKLVKARIAMQREIPS